MLVFTEYIAKKELKPLRKQFDLEDVLDGARKVLKNLAIEIKSPGSVKNARFFKVRIGKKTKGRMIVFLVVSSSKVVPILIRLKKDKIFGTNMSVNNPAVVDQMNKNLNRVMEDIQKGKYEEFPL